MASPTDTASRRWPTAWRLSVTTSRSSRGCCSRVAPRYEGRYAHVRGAINVPQGLQKPRIPIIVGGNGRQRTAGYAIRFAEELNFVFLEADDIVDRMRDVRERCEADGRDPATMRFSLYERDERMRDAGQARVDRLARFAEIGLDRLVAFPTRWSPTLDAQAAFAEDCRAAGISLSAEAAAVGP